MVDRSETSDGRGKRRSSVPSGPATASFPIARFGLFRLIDRIDRGGAESGSELYRALWAQTPREPERLCVLKRLRPELVSSPTFVRMFEQEAQVLAALDHPNLVKTFERGLVETVPYVAMEYLEGLDLASLLRSIRTGAGTLPIEVGIFIAHEVAKALAHGHGARDQQGAPLGLVHRDVKPTNVVLLPNGVVKLIDFGVTRVSSFIAQNVTSEGSRSHKPSYVAPEQVRGGLVDARADLFALGVVLWEMLTGRPMFPPADPRETAARLVTGDQQRPSVLRSDVTPPLDNLVMRLLNRDLNQRYQTAASVVQDLALFLPAPADDARAVGSLVRSHMETRPAVAGPPLLLPNGKPVPPALAGVFESIVNSMRAGGLAGRLPGSIRKMTSFVPMVAARFPRRPPARNPGDPAPAISINTPAGSFKMPRRPIAPVLAYAMVAATLALGAGASWRYLQGDTHESTLEADAYPLEELPPSMMHAAFVTRPAVPSPSKGIVIESLSPPPATTTTAAEKSPAQVSSKGKRPGRRHAAKAASRRNKRVGRISRNRAGVVQADAVRPAKK